MTRLAATQPYLSPVFVSSAYCKSSPRICWGWSRQWRTVYHRRRPRWSPCASPAPGPRTSPDRWPRSWSPNSRTLGNNTSYHRPDFSLHPCRQQPWNRKNGGGRKEEGRGKNFSFNHSYKILSWDEIRKEGRKRETYPNNWFPRPGSVPCSAFSTARPSCTWWCNIESGDYAPQGPPRWWGNRYWPPSPSDFSEDLASVLTIRIHRLIIMVDEEAELERTSFLS